jgi:MFS family permease
MSSEMIFPILPLFLVNVLGASMVAVGLIEGVAESTTSILKMVFGWYSDKKGRRKPFVTSGYTMSTVVKPFFSLATSWIHVLGLRFAERVGKGLRTAARDALVASSCDAKVKGKAFGLHRALDTTGAVIGPLIAFMLLPALGFRNIFLVATMPAALAVALLIIFAKEKPIQKNEKTEFKLSFNSFNREFKIYLAISALFSIGNFSWAFLILRAKDLGVSDEAAIMLYLMFNLVYALLSLPSGILSDKIGRRPLIAGGYITFGIMCIGFALATEALWAILLFVLYGVFMSVYEGVQRAYVTDLVAQEMCGTALGTFNMIIGITAFPASLIAGLLWQLTGPTTTFLLAAVLSFISAVLLVGAKIFPPNKKSILKNWWSPLIF